MFKFFKEKVKGWVKKSAETVETSGIEKATEETEKPEERKEEPAEKEPTKEEKEEKPAEKRSFFRKIKEKALSKRKEAGEKEPEKKAEEVPKTEEDELKRLEKEVEEVEKEVEEEAGKKEEERLEKEVEEAREIEKLEKEVEEVEKEVEEVEKKPEEKVKEKEEAKELYEPEIKAPEEWEEEAEPEKNSIFQKLKQKFSYKLSEEDFENIFQDLELMLLESNVALEATEAIKKELQKELVGKEIKKDSLEEEIKKSLKKAIENILIEPDDILSLIKEKKPFVIVFFGVNGAGKSTTIAKIASLLKNNGISCVLAAADTFRAASIEQLQHHATALNLKIIKHDYGADPAAVAFDAIKHAKAHNIDAVLIDTAGRMHTQDNLLSEMEKICRVTEPDLKIFVAESIAGNDAIQQSRNFDEKIGIDGTILTKADVDEKGGAAISISYVTKKPILFLGTGQEYNQLILFDKEKFIGELGL